MPESLKVLCVHGIGDHHTDLSWQRQWRDVIVSGVHRWDPRRTVDVQFVLYDHLFDGHTITPAGAAEALIKLLGSGIVHGVQDLFRPRARGAISERLRWTAGMVVQWAENERLRRQTRELLLGAIDRFAPDVIGAHSLGSLVAYDTFVHPTGRGAIEDRVFVSFGSQIGNPFVRSQFGGRIVELQRCRRWFHLFNAEDDVFTAEIRLSDETFEQVNTEFDLPGPLDHEATSYLGHVNAINRVWASLAGGADFRRLNRSRTLIVRAARAKKRTARRALLVGINEYPDPKDRLDGCVNDVFQVSSVLQECGFAAQDIRVVLNGRATAANIRSRLEWLLEDASAGDQRVLYYSGHGAQLPQYASDEKVDHMNECLVPHDFDWAGDHAITDDELFELYSQLDYATQFLIMLDCCHSGGMTRDGGCKVRGLNPPDDIRHRALRWDARLQMWKPREFEAVSERGPQYVGASRANLRLGRAVRLRTLARREYNRVRQAVGHRGPYLPIILQACGEQELAYEYRHGVTSYGAFTYALAQQLRRSGTRGMTFKALCAAVTAALADLGYEQHPELVGPKTWINRRVPWTRARG